MHVVKGADQSVHFDYLLGFHKLQARSVGNCWGQQRSERVVGWESGEDCDWRLVMQTPQRVVQDALQSACDCIPFILLESELGQQSSCGS